MYYIYTDEAGTSALEPWTVVVGILVKDSLVQPTIDAINLLKDEFVPAPFRPGFISHATDIINDRKKNYRTQWALATRTEFLRRMMMIPATTLSLGFAWTAVSRECDNLPPIKTKRGLLEQREQIHHAYAFGRCMAAADRLIRAFGTDTDTGHIIAEQVNGSSLLGKTIPSLRLNPHLVPIEDALNPEAERVDGNMPEHLELRVDRIVDGVRFIPKGIEPILELADACAFGLRRFAAGERFGHEFLRAIYTGRDPSRSVRLTRGGNAGNAFIVGPATTNALMPNLSYSATFTT